MSEVSRSDLLARRVERLRRSAERGAGHRTIEQIAVLGVAGEQLGIPVAGLRVDRRGIRVAEGRGLGRRPFEDPVGVLQPALDA